MKMKNKKTNQDALLDLMDEFRENPPEEIKPVGEDKKESELGKVETLEDLTHAWEERSTKHEESKKLLFDDNAPIFQNREEVISYYTRRVITAPYMNVVLQQLFGDKPEQWIEVEAEANKHLLPRIPNNLVERAAKELTYWNRVKTTTAYKRRNGVEITDPCWDEFVDHMINKWLREIQYLSYLDEKRSQEELEFEFRNNKNNKPRRSVNK